MNLVPKFLIKGIMFITKRDVSRRLRSFKKSAFLFETNKQIENGTALNWKAFKELKDYHKDEESFDSYDLNNFYLRILYSLSECL